MSGDRVAATPIAVAFLVALGLALIMTRAVLRRLQARAIFDRPNERSMHLVPTPRGGGIGILAALLPIWCGAVYLGYGDASSLAVAAAVLILAAVSWRDDIGGLSPTTRLLVQALTVIGGLAFLPGAGTVLQGLLPSWLDLVCSALLWLWFVNAFNFMDGIDGIAGTEAAAIGIGVVLLGLLHSDVVGLGASMLAATTAGAALGFLGWNWQPAKLFMGDVGSVPLGYLLGWLLLNLATAGYWAPALILPLYFLADASWTLLRRLLRGEKIWRPHREHFYQRAVQAGCSHQAVVLRVLVADLVFVGAALWAAAGRELPALAIALVAVGVLLVDLSRTVKSA
jgi:UDP-N-acetylmuramyl pentapeptide phosphotransferase/UDP-N-acetylglucosamine-1-phosphate transferase